MRLYATGGFSIIRICFLRFSTGQYLRKDLFGRDVLEPNGLTIRDWKKILWIGFDLKQTLMKNGKEKLNLLNDKHVTFLFIKPSGRNLLSCSRASQILGASFTYFPEPEFESQPNSVDSGKALSRISDLILVNGCNQSNLSKIAEGSSVPVVGLTTNMFSILKALAFLMTIQEHYGYLKSLKLTWIGPSSSLCNTVFSIFPSFGISIKFCCICAHGTGQMTPTIYKQAVLSSNKGSAEIHQCSNAAEAIFKSNVIIPVPHPEEKNRITLQLLEEAEFDWILLHPLPRTDIEVSDDLFQHVNNLTWECSGNYLYVAMALMLSTLSDYQPTSPTPCFEGCV